MTDAGTTSNYIRRLRPHSNSEVNRAAAELLSRPDPPAFARAFDVIAEWRTLHFGPVALFRTILEAEARSVDPGSFVADRLKRIPTILEKLQRYPQMKLSTMQDIGGLRAVVETVAQAHALSDRLTNTSAPVLTAAFRLKGSVTDYIQSPTHWGYRGLHLVYTYKSTREENRHLEGLKIEVQIRTRLQHLWATAVEVVGTFRGEPLKSGQGDYQWLEFFRLAGAVLGGKDSSGNLVLTPELVALRDKINVFDRMSAFTVADQLVRSPEATTVPDVQEARFFLLELDINEHSVQVTPFAPNDFERAVQWQRLAEIRHAGKDYVDTVLVTVDSLAELREAYPNYFADTRDFIDLVYGGSAPAT